jgi:hypothetical protein
MSINPAARARAESGGTGAAVRRAGLEAVAGGGVGDGAGRTADDDGRADAGGGPVEDRAAGPLHDNPVRASNEAATKRPRAWPDRTGAITMRRMARRTGRVSAIVIAGLVLAGCSASSSPEPPASTPSAVAPTVDPGAAAVQGYLGRVNALCDALLPKVLKVIKGGHPGVYPVQEFFAELPAHQGLRNGFDRQLAAIPAPPAARTQAAALQAYIRFANQLDARRLAAARRGQAAFDRETLGERAYAPNHPTIGARTAAGFHDSCNAR